MNKNNLIKIFPCGHQSCAPCTMKGYESKEIDFVCEYLDKINERNKMTGVFIDVGAHVGLWAMQMSEWYRTRYKSQPLIYALEPDELNYRVLFKNAKQETNSGIVPVQVAAWNTNEMLFLKRQTNPGRHYVTDIGMHSRQAIRVKGITLDTASQSKAGKDIDVIKVDVEGAELNVMNGAREIMMNNKQLLVVLEYSIEHMNNFGYRPSQLTNFMLQHGYRPARPEDVKVTTRILAGELKRVMFVKGDII